MEKEGSRGYTSTGKCNLCDRTLAKTGMARHLKSCWERQAVSEAVSGGPKAREQRIFLIAVGTRYPSDYWMYLEVSAAAKLIVLDAFLRDTWLECCGHMSVFEITGEMYYSSGARELEGRTMNVQLGKVLTPGVKVFYEYDFGTATELALTVMAERKGFSSVNPVRVLARNDPPQILCQSCGKPATKVCCQCIDEGEGWLCNACSRKHDCGEDMFLPVVNSPRVGMCAYEG
ncbi:MAG: hypothetical protein Q7R39_15265 [Dehalococcoidia bacterium]|nr:hypothetical protein [Dehalococcoidia bacterium]